ncbi:thermophilic serine proteinase [Peptoclostridium acidaminophilum DSM 3953]|uniref:Thermophilic serine proteinase n=1 Tax=Peptoclostridium acidaminophilum DSM 3953 TaxID=1286171 RepID=W8U8K5_PEPAC|nr:S8 family serine peptidase [Peptoclostridium acidaminophilum]AHM57186.1 thermophilic serine proteinase [Peptoclostridium acidaminophilum DSM 3953]
MKSNIRVICAFALSIALFAIPAESLAESGTKMENEISSKAESITYETASKKNPFEELDKIRDERIAAARERVRKTASNRDDKIKEERKRKEEELISSPGLRYIVKFNDYASMEEIFEAVSPYKHRLIGDSKNRTFMIKAADIEGFKQEAEDLVDFVEKDRQTKIQAVPSDTDYAKQWALPAIDMQEAWDITTGSGSVLVAVIDSGVNRSHPDLAGTDIRNGWDYIMDEPCQYDSVGHGTNVTGIIGAQTDNARGIAGVNWDVAIVPLNVVYSNELIYTSDICAALVEAADMGCDVINLSLSGPDYSSAENEAVQYAISKGCIVVAAAGNWGNSAYSYPASYEGVISVASVDSSISYSSFSQYNDKVDLAAPGEGILTTADMFNQGKEYMEVSGTSFSAPHVAGVAALAAACKPSITPSEFTEALEASSVDLGSAGFDIHYGHGLLNAERTLVYVTNPDVPGNLRVDSIGDKSASLRWNASWEFDVEGYRLEYKQTEASTWSSVSLVKNETMHTVSGLTNGKAYSFRIKAIDEAGNWSEYSQTVEAVPVVTLEMPEKTNVPLDKSWTVEFNSQPDMATVGADTVYIKDSGGELVECSLKKGDIPNTIVISPVDDYTPDETYTIYITQGVMSQGNKLTKTTYMRFTTAE